MTESERYADLLGQTAILMSKLSTSSDPRRGRILAKVSRRYERLLTKYLELDPDLEAIGTSQAVNTHLDDMISRGSNILTIYGWHLDRLDPTRKYDLMCLSFATIMAMQSEEASSADINLLMTTATLAAYRLGLEDGMKGFAMSLNVKMGGD